MDNQSKIEEIKSKGYILMIKEEMKLNNGYITTKEVNAMGIHRMYLNIMKNNGIIEQVGNGIYIDSEIIPDNYYILSKELPNMVFSHMTALYFWNLAIKAPTNEYDITVKNNYFNYKIKKHNVFYISDELYNLGLTRVETPMGNIVKVYDIERCICDIIRSKNRMDIEHIKYSIKEYLKRKDKDLVKLASYADKMNIKDKVMELVGMMYE